MLRLSDLSNDLIDEFDDLKVYRMALVDCIDHHFFFYFICACLDHDDFFSCRSNRQAKITLIPLKLGRVDDQLAVYHTHLCHCTRTVKRDIRNAGRNCGTKHRGQLRTALRINGHYHVV